MIKVTDADDGDVFTCVAENNFGSYRKETNIIFVNLIIFAYEHDS